MGHMLRGMVPPDRQLVLLGDNFRRLRKDRGWTQEELAARADVDERHYQDVEAGKVEIGVKYLGKLHRVLGADWNGTMARFGLWAEAF